MADDTTSAPLIPFKGNIMRSNISLFEVDSPVLIRSGIGGLVYQVAERDLSESQAKSLDATISELADPPAHLVTFRHPQDSSKIVGVVLFDPNAKPEIDGVWVADDGSGGEGGGRC